MSKPTKRTRLRAVYLTDVERDLVQQALRVMKASIIGEETTSYRAVKFARSFTATRLEDCAALFDDAATKVANE